MYKVGLFESVDFPHTLTTYSNLTFGAGGKNKDGRNVTGWGYYEVSSISLPS